MNRMLSMLLALSLGLFLSGGLGYAEMIEGTISSLDAGKNSFQLSKADSGEQLSIAVLENTKYSGYQGFADLKEGDLVKVDASKNGNNIFEAKTLEKK